MKNESMMILMQLFSRQQKEIGLDHIQEEVFNLQHYEKQKQKLINYVFFRWSNGPFSPDLENDIKELRKLGYLKSNFNYFFELSERGKHEVKDPKNELSEIWKRRLSEYRDIHYTANLGDVINEEDIDYLYLNKNVE